MKAWIQDIRVEGTPEEIARFKELTRYRVTLPSQSPTTSSPRITRMNEKPSHREKWYRIQEDNKIHEELRYKYYNR